MEKLLRTDERAREKFIRRMEADNASPQSEGPLSRLVLELVLTAAYAPSIVAEVLSLRRGWVVVRRGDASLDPDDFDITRCYGALGRKLLHERRAAP